MRRFEYTGVTKQDIMRPIIQGWTGNVLLYFHLFRLGGGRMSAQKVDAAIRTRIHALLDDAFGDRLQGVVLYGSEARGTADSDSDADLLVLLRGPMALGKDLKTIIDALYPLQLEVGRPIHALPVEATVYAEGEFSLYRNARKEGVLL